MGLWTACKHACKVSSFLQRQIFLYDLNTPLLTLILEEVLSTEYIFDQTIA
jgi:hypothetical protein